MNFVLLVIKVYHVGRLPYTPLEIGHQRNANISVRLYDKLLFTTNGSNKKKK